MFGWVASDIDAKMEIIRGLKNGEQSEKYQSVQSMIQYEVDNNLIKHKAKDSSTGTRNLLRLHRALEYIVAFLDGKTYGLTSYARNSQKKQYLIFGEMINTFRNCL